MINYILLTLFQYIHHSISIYLVSLAISRIYFLAKIVNYFLMTAHGLHSVGRKGLSLSLSLCEVEGSSFSVVVVVSYLIASIKLDLSVVGHVALCSVLSSLTIKLNKYARNKGANGDDATDLYPTLPYPSLPYSTLALEDPPPLAALVIIQRVDQRLA